MLNLSEALLARLTDPTRAAAIYGDLVELAASRGRAWFWLAYLRTLATLLWRTPTAFGRGIAVAEGDQALIFHAVQRGIKCAGSGVAARTGGDFRQDGDAVSCITEAENGQQNNLLEFAERRTGFHMEYKVVVTTEAVKLFFQCQEEVPTARGATTSWRVYALRVVLPMVAIELAKEIRRLIVKSVAGKWQAI